MKNDTWLHDDDYRDWVKKQKMCPCGRSVGSCQHTAHSVVQKPMKPVKLTAKQILEQIMNREGPPQGTVIK